MELVFCKWEMVFFHHTLAFFYLGYQDHFIPFKWDFVTAKGLDVECWLLQMLINLFRTLDFFLIIVLEIQLEKLLICFVYFWQMFQKALESCHYSSNNISILARPGKDLGSFLKAFWSIARTGCMIWQLNGTRVWSCDDSRECWDC